MYMVYSGHIHPSVTPVRPSHSFQTLPPPTASGFLSLSCFCCMSPGVYQGQLYGRGCGASHWSMSNSPMETAQTQWLPGPHWWLSLTALTITIGLTGMFSCEVPDGGSVHSGNLITSLWYRGFFGYGFRGEEGGNLNPRRNTLLLQTVGDRLHSTQLSDEPTAHSSFSYCTWVMKSSAQQ